MCLLVFFFSFVQTYLHSINILEYCMENLQGFVAKVLLNPCVGISNFSHWHLCSPWKQQAEFGCFHISWLILFGQIKHLVLLKPMVLDGTHILLSSAKFIGLAVCYTIGSTELVHNSAFTLPALFSFSACCNLNCYLYAMLQLLLRFKQISWSWDLVSVTLQFPHF